MTKTDKEILVGTEKWSDQVRSGFYFGIGFFLALLIGWLIVGTIAWIIIFASLNAGAIL